MIDNTILAGGAAVAPEITVDPTGLITATAGGKTSTLQQQTGEFGYSEGGDAFFSAKTVYLLAQGFMPGVDAAVMERSWDVNNIARVSHAFPMGDGSTLTQDAICIPLTYPVYGGKSGILSFAISVSGKDYSGSTDMLYIFFGPVSGVAAMHNPNFDGSTLYDASGSVLYIAAGISSIGTDVPPKYVVVYRRA